MSHLKSIFISLYFSFLVFSFLFTGYQLIDGALDEIYFFASFVSTLTLLIFYSYLYVRKPKEVSLFNIVIFTIVGASFLICLGFYLTEGSIYRFPMVFAGINLLGWILYISWYIKFKAISHENIEKHFNEVSSVLTKSSQRMSDFQLYLYRNNNLSPFCVRQQKEFEKASEAFSNKNTNIIIISPEEPMNINQDTNVSYINNSDGSQSKPIDLLVPQRAPFGLGRKIENRFESIPTVVLTYKNDEILWIYTCSDDRKRPQPDFFMRIIDQKIGKNL